MTLLMLFIRRFSFILNVKLTFPFTKILLMALMSVLIQGCVSLVETENQAPEDLDSLGKNIVDMVDVPADEVLLCKCGRLGRWPLPQPLPLGQACSLPHLDVLQQPLWARFA